MSRSTREAFLGYHLEKTFSGEEILTLFLNCQQIRKEAPIILISENKRTGSM